MSACRIEHRTWAELGPARRAAIVAVGTAQIALAAFAAVDLARRPRDLVRGSKAAWAPALLVNWAGPLAYLLVGRRRA
ncbi:MAG: PLD nuclease N-terminal domain-containing protein [Pseudoclavibacter sp.]